jgi:hypothetical protein
MLVDELRRQHDCRVGREDEDRPHEPAPAAHDGAPEEEQQTPQAQRDRNDEADRHSLLRVVLGWRGQRPDRKAQVAGEQDRRGNAHPVPAPGHVRHRQQGTRLRTAHDRAIR